MILTILWVATLLVALGLYLRQTYTRFSRHGVKNFTPLPILGNSSEMLLRGQHFAYNIEKTYNTFKPTERFVGTYMFMRPALFIIDLDLLKKIAVKDFEYFLDHQAIVSEETDPFFGRNLFSLRGQEWKDMRATLSPAFTSSKIRVMVPFMVEVGDQMIRALKKKIAESGVDFVDVDTKDLGSRYANDVIATCAFGLKVDSHTEEDNDFFKMGKTATNFSFYQMLKFFGYMSFPNFMKLFKISLFTEKTKQFFKNLVLTTMSDRERLNIIRPDMIHLLMEAKKGQLLHEDKNSKEKDDDAGFATVEESAVGKNNINRVWSEEDLIAQAVLFFIAGFETVSSEMSFLLHELALHPEIQERLAKEIQENDEKNNGKFDYNSIQNMTYMDMVVSEVLRLWPAAVALDRRCVKDYNCGRPNESATEDYIIRKDESLSFPVWAIHRDSKYFPDPEKFDPERFSDENKHKIKPFTYLPFGLGPRNCIGSRFALCEMKVMAYQLLQHMVVSPCEKTCIPSELSGESLNLRLKGGHWLRFRVRN